jgi:hypothetical protein
VAVNDEVIKVRTWAILNKTDAYKKARAGTQIQGRETFI